MKWLLIGTNAPRDGFLLYGKEIIVGYGGIGKAAT
jgi:hypothetical protein